MLVQYWAMGMFQSPHLSVPTLRSPPPEECGYTDNRPWEYATNRGENSGSAPSPMHYTHTLCCPRHRQAISSFQAPLMPSTLSSKGNIHDVYAAPFQMACFFNHAFPLVKMMQRLVGM